MAKIQTYKIPVTIINGEVKLDHSKRELLDEGNQTNFEESRVALKAQEIAEFNKNEVELVKSFGDGSYSVEHKLIV